MNRILIDYSVHQVRTALVEDGELVELQVEGIHSKNIVGNIFAGRVASVVAGMQAVFVDIGEEKNAYFYIEQGRPKPKTGQSLLVQVEKPATGTKGAVVTDNLSFAGKFVVLLPNQKEIGISKKITDEEERKRIKEIAKKLLPENYGIIIRTNGEYKSEEEYKEELEKLLLVCEDVLKRGTYTKPPFLLYGESSPALKAARELFTAKVNEFVVNDKKEYEKLVQAVSKQDIPKIKYYDSNVPLFENYFLESQIEKALARKVWLKSGGFLIIEQTEACVVIDVNTGKFTGKKNQQATFIKTNKEAALEIAKQIRLRNLSGIIIIDFIDMKEEEQRKELRVLLEQETKKDRIKTVIVGMTELGLMQITRKKTSPSLAQILTTNCRCCEGSGRVPSVEWVVAQMRRAVISIFVQTIYNQVTITADERLLYAFAGKEEALKKELEKEYNKKIVLNPKPHLAFGYYEIEKDKVEDNG